MKQPLDASDETELALLVGRARGGSAGAFEELVRRVHSRLRRWAQRLTGDADDAEDILFIRLSPWELNLSLNTLSSKDGLTFDASLRLRFEILADRAESR